MAQQKAQKQADTEEKITVDQAKRDAALKQINDLNEKGAVGSWWSSVLHDWGPNGSSLRPDPGRYNPKPISGVDLVGRKDKNGKEIDPDTHSIQRRPSN